ncbi:MAG: hypothetical protein PHN64_06825 [Desulfovibrionaceae bacterium]|nr:hypothetical protein [Desulfovibrionaceae bacterium]
MNNKGIVATLAELEGFYKGQAAGDVIELMNQSNDCLNDIPWMEANQSDGHLTRIRTGLPDVYWRRLYQGTPPSKSAWSQVKEGCGLLEAIMELDLEETRLYGDKAKTFRLSEGQAFTESMRQKVAHTLFYGDNSASPDEFNGLAKRYPAKDSPNVLDAGGTSGNMTSLYLISWGANAVHGIYPKGSQGGLEHKDLGEYMAVDEDGRKFEVAGDKYNWRCGLAVRDWRAVVRLANVPVANLGKRKGESGFIDLQALTVQAKNRMPQHLRDKAVWYCNQDVLTALELQSTDAGNVHLMYGEMFNSRAIPSLHGRPVRQCDALSSSESAL